MRNIRYSLIDSIQFGSIVIRKEAHMFCKRYLSHMADSQPPDDPDEDKGGDGGDGE